MGKNYNFLIGLSSFLALISYGVIYFDNEVVLGVVDLINYNFGIIYGGESVFVESFNGKLEGFTSKSRDGKLFYEFIGIPFAEPPVGELRFEPPIPIAPWKGVKSAKSYGYKCLQYELLIPILSGNEDCLTLNVYTPKLDGSLPVILFFHGGAFMFGKSDLYRPDYLIDENVVVVTSNYRLAAFGFLNTGDEVIRGNMGLKDQVLTLKWIQKNIKDFGGNPHLVTILGESAGAASAQLHMLSPLSKDLFHRVISLSGSSLSHWAWTSEPKKQSLYFGKKLKCPTNNSTALSKCLKSLDALTIANTFRGFEAPLHNRYEAFAPSSEGIKDEKTFIAEHPREVLKRGEILTKVPWINGLNKKEGLIYAISIFLRPEVLEELNKNWIKHAPVLYDFERNPNKEEISKAIYKFYMKNERINRDTLHNFTDLFTDSSWSRSFYETVDFHINSTEMFLYFYTYEAKFGIGQIFLDIPVILPVSLNGILVNSIDWIQWNFFGVKRKHHGPCHADELSVIFRFPGILTNVEKGSPDYAVSKEFTRIIAKFAENGKPPLVKNVKWERANNANKVPLKFLQLDNTIQIVNEPFKERVAFWKTLNINK